MEQSFASCYIGWGIGSKVPVTTFTIAAWLQDWIGVACRWPQLASQIILYVLVFWFSNWDQIFWLAGPKPIVRHSKVLGLALDYDIFLLGRTLAARCSIDSAHVVYYATKCMLHDGEVVATVCVGGNQEDSVKDGSNCFYHLLLYALFLDFASLCHVYSFPFFRSPSSFPQHTPLWPCRSLRSFELSSTQ